MQPFCKPQGSGAAAHLIHCSEGTPNTPLGEREEARCNVGDTAVVLCTGQLRVGCDRGMALVGEALPCRLQARLRGGATRPAELLALAA